MSDNATRSPTPAHTGSGRYPFIDALRGLAVFFMMETHTVNALLDPGLRRGAFYDALTYVNGLVAPAFLFCAGLGFAIFLSRRNDEIVSLGPGFRSYLKKCLFIVFLGYSLHVPVFSLKGMMALPPGERMAFLQVDILQVIGVTLVLLLAVVILVRSPRSRTILTGAMTAAFLLWGYVRPAEAGWSAGVVPAWIAAYVSRDLSPLFTIVPWAAFLTTGFLAGTRFVAEAASGRETTVIRTFALVSAALIAAAFVLSSFTRPLYAPGEYWYWSAEYFLVRLGSVGLVMCLLRYLVRGGGGPGSRVLGVFGRESLPVYYIHLIVVYGKDFGWSFVRTIPAELGYAACAGLTLILAGAMYLCGLWWGAAKRSWPRGTAIAVRLLVAGSVVSFLVS